MKELMLYAGNAPAVKPKEKEKKTVKDLPRVGFTAWSNWWVKR